MKRYLGILVAFVGLVAAIIVTYNKYNGLRIDAERELDRVKLERDYLERVSWVRSNPDDKAYRVEANAMFRWYFASARDLAERYGTSPEFNQYLDEIDSHPDDAKLAERKARYDYVRKVFNQMNAGKYDPVWTASDKGMRLDVLSSSIQTVDGQPKIHLELALWGASREMKEESHNLKRMMASADFDGKVKLLDAKGKSHYELAISGDPSMKIDWPERYVWAFPPQMVLGYYDLPLFPSDATKAEISFHVSSRTVFGGLADSSFVWAQDIPAQWKGGQWKDAEVAVRPADEIDPSKKPKSAHAQQ